MIGDLVASALARVGITPERVSAWLGHDCGCEERRVRLNAVEAWAKRVLAGRTEQAIEYLKRILDAP